MASRSIQSTTLGFGLVTVPVSLHTAVKSRTVKMVQLCEVETIKDGVPTACNQRLKQPKKCPVHGEIIADQVGRGFEVNKKEGIYLPLTKAEIASVQVRSVKSIQVEAFFHIGEVDRRLFDSPYYLAPGKGGEAAYGLLLRVMQECGVVGVAKITIRGEKEHLCIVTPADGILQLFTLHWADEVEPCEDLKPRLSRAYSEKEIEMGKKLVESMLGKFEPEKFEDEYRLALEKLIANKQAGIVVTPTEIPEPVATPADNLLEKLMASVGAA